MALAGQFARKLLALALAATAALACATALAEPATVHAARGEVTALAPLQFYLARGEENACGPGCSEWIAADGAFDQGAAARLKRFLARFHDRKPPIFFNSPGGIVSQAIAIGRMLHDFDAVAGVAQTVPDNCARDKRIVCSELKRSGRTLTAELQTALAQCSSACVYALIGARTRLVLPGARVGIHSDKLVRIYSDGHMVAPPRSQLSTVERVKIEEDRERLKRYVVEMGLSPQLVDAAIKISHDQVYMLSRDEIVRYGIDTRASDETRWTVTEGQKQFPSIMKFVYEARAPQEFRTSLIRLACESPSDLRIAYIRGLASDDADAAITIKLVAGDRVVKLAGSGPRTKIEAIDSGTSFESRIGDGAIAFFEAAAAGGEIDIVETTERGGEPRSRVIKLSTAGLSHALSILRATCGRAA